MKLALTNSPCSTQRTVIWDKANMDYAGPTNFSAASDSGPANYWVEIEALRVRVYMAPWAAVAFSTEHDNLRIL